MKKSAISLKPGVTVAGEERFAIFPKRHVGVHAGAVVAEERLRHERDGLVVLLRDVPDDVFVILHVVGHLLHRSETDVDFGLAGGGDFMMLALDRDAGFLQLETHLVADVLQGVGRRNREIAFLRANFVAEIREFFLAAVPMAFRAIDEVER